MTVEATAPDAEVGARGTPRLWLAGAVAFLVVSLLAGLAIGPARIGFWPILESALSQLPFVHLHSHLSESESAIVWQIRAPRVAIGALVGGMLAVAGSAYQGAFRNPLADPYLLGVASGAGLGATIVIAYGHTAGGLVPVAAFLGAALSVALAYALGRSVGGTSTSTTLILAGVAVAYFMNAVQTFVQQQRSESLRDVFAWLLGGFATASWSDVAIAAPYVLPSAVVLLAHRRLLDVLSVGDDEAAALGVDVRRVRLLVVTAATVGTAAAVAVSGLIAFVGIIVPHAIRLLVSPSYRAIVPLSLVAGAGFLVLTDVLARTVLSPAELPISVVTAFFGAPFFAIVLRASRASRA
jgi:iron complex transport system permease protein